MKYLINSKNNNFIKFESYTIPITDSRYNQTYNHFYNQDYNQDYYLSIQTFDDTREILPPFNSYGRYTLKKEYAQNLLLYDEDNSIISRFINSFIRSVNINDDYNSPLNIEIGFDYYEYNEIDPTDSLNNYPEIFRFIRLKKIKKLLSNGDYNGEVIQK